MRDGSDPVMAKKSSRSTTLLWVMRRKLSGCPWSDGALIPATSWLPGTTNESRRGSGDNADDTWILNNQKNTSRALRYRIVVGNSFIGAPISLALRLSVSKSASRVDHWPCNRCHIQITSRSPMYSVSNERITTVSFQELRGAYTFPIPTMLS